MLEQLMHDPAPEREPSTATFMFADIAGFTALTEAHGDEEAATLVADFCSAVNAELPAAGGSQVKTIGDALMLRIPDPEDAIRLGLRIAHDVLRGHGSPAVRVGLHHGPAIERDSDYFGAAVNLAARLAAAATGGEVLLTAHTAAMAPDLDGVGLRVPWTPDAAQHPRTRRARRCRAPNAHLRPRTRDRPGLPHGRRPQPRRRTTRLR
jgi:class 3 adenylate cyclase